VPASRNAAGRRRAAISARPSIVASVIPGAISRAQVAQNLAAFNHPIPADLWAELKHEKAAARRCAGSPALTRWRRERMSWYLRGTGLRNDLPTGA